MGCLESPPHVVDRLQTVLEEGRHDELLGCFMREVAGLPPDQVELMRSLPALSLVASAGSALAQTRRHLPVRDRALATNAIAKGRACRTRHLRRRLLKFWANQVECRTVSSAPESRTA
jgi:hypothetical protein